MNCQSYQNLTPKEKAEFIGQLVHAVQNNDDIFKLGQELIELATIKGMFENVVIMPTGQNIREPEIHNIP